MKISTRSVLTGCILAFCTVLILLYYSAPSGPEYTGKPLGSWLKHLDVSAPPESQAAAREAIDALGTNAIPHLLELLNQQDSRAKKLGIWLNRKLSFFGTWIEPASVHHQRALAGFHILGQESDPFVDELVPLLDRPETAVAAITALSNLGIIAVPAFTKAITNESARVRALAALQLGYRRSGEETVPLLLNALENDSSAGVRSAAAFALGRFESHSAIIVPALMTALDEDLPYVGMNAISALGKFGPKAQGAVTKLKEIMAGKGPLALSAAGAMLQIDPAAARESGIPVTARLGSFE